MITYLTWAIATGLLVKADNVITEQELLLSTYIIVSCLWFITLPCLLWSLFARTVIWLTKQSN